MGRPNAVRKGADQARQLIKDQQEAQQRAEEEARRPPPDLSQFIDGEGESANGQGQGQNASPPPAPEEHKPDGQGQRPADGERDSGSGDGTGRAPKAAENLDRDELLRENDRLQQQYRVLKGKYDKEVTPLTNQVRELKQQIEALKEGAGQNTGNPGSGGVTLEQAKEKLLEELPEETVNAFLGAIESVRTGQPSVDPDELQSIKRRMDESENRNFRQQLTGLVPNWVQIDQDPEFNDKFLWETEGNTGQPKGVFYKQAAEQRDAKQCAAFLNEFLARKNKGARQAPPPDPGPGTGDRQQPTNDGQSRQWKRSEITAIEAAAKAGKYRGKEDQLQKARASYRKALAEKRVDMNA